MAEKRDRPVGIYLENCEDVEISDSSAVGDLDFLVAKSSKNIRGHGNRHISNERSAAKHWYEKPLGKIAIGVIVMVVGSAAVYLFGW